MKMKKAVQKLLALLLIFSLVIAGAIPASAANTSDGTAAGVRTNLVFQEGRSGDTHLVYTYDQDGKGFKVEENFSEGLTNGNSTTYVRNPNGDYVVFSTQTVACGAIATYYCGSAEGQAAIAGLTSLAASLFNINATTAYYDTIYNWRNSPRNWLVNDETEWTDWYPDSARNNDVGYSYFDALSHKLSYYQERNLNF